MAASETWNTRREDVAARDTDSRVALSFAQIPTRQSGRMARLRPRVPSLRVKFTIENRQGDRFVRRTALIIATAVLALISSGSRGIGAEDDASRLAGELKPWLTCLAGQQETFAVSGNIDVKIDGSLQHIAVRLERFSDDAFDLDLTHADYAVQLRRRRDATAMALPLHKVVFLGKGATDAADRLTPEGITTRLVSSASMVSAYAPLVQSGDAGTVALLLTGLLKVERDAVAEAWRVGGVTVRFTEAGRSVQVASADANARLSISETVSAPVAVDVWPGLKTVALDRAELERQLVRGVRRALEIVAPSPRLTSPARTAKKVAHGELRWIDGQRVALLQGTPEQIGTAHGQLLKTEAMRCIDSVLYSFGTVETVRSGRWFRHKLDDAYARLAPHIPERHKQETRAMAKSLGLEPGLAETLNVFPELFHCSGFAVFGTATTNGKLYHGRVLDYMTTIGLQDAATTFIVAPQGKIAFANVGYAGFIGSVSGMNAQSISLGEMGGRGEGLWDGAPMATLMRRALEECDSLDAVKTLWRDSPRTCEYYYVFADGKTNQAVGVAATPESIQFVEPGQGHELLGAGIPDAVVLSAGSRLEKLRARVLERHGEIDAELGQWLMSRPVAMQSNLHNVLFVPEDGILYVANADHKHPAAERPYVRLDLNALLKEMPGPVAATVAAAGESAASAN